MSNSPESRVVLPGGYLRDALLSPEMTGPWRCRHLALNGPSGIDQLR
jgi:hypothetical protein